MEKEVDEVRKLKQWVCDLDLIVESRSLFSVEIENRIEWKKKILELEHRRNMDLRQKAKIRWAIDGDEDSRFFHGIINSNLSKNRINGLLIGGNWSTNPMAIKNEIFFFFKEKFAEKMRSRPSLSCNFNKTLSKSEATFLIEPFCPEEIKAAVWECGNERAPGPDGFHLNLSKKIRLHLNQISKIYFFTFMHLVTLTRAETPHLSP